MLPRNKCRSGPDRGRGVLNAPEPGLGATAGEARLDPPTAPPPGHFSSCHDPRPGASPARRDRGRGSRVEGSLSVGPCPGLDGRLVRQCSAYSGVRHAGGDPSVSTRTAPVLRLLLERNPRVATVEVDDTVVPARPDRRRIVWKVLGRLRAPTWSGRGGPVDGDAWVVGTRPRAPGKGVIVDWRKNIQNFQETEETRRPGKCHIRPGRRRGPGA